MNRVVSVLVIVGLAWGNTAWAAEKITWLTVNYPPLWITSGPQQGTGCCDGAQTVLRSNLPAYEHIELETSSIARILNFLNGKDGVYCMTCANYHKDSPMLLSNLALASVPVGIVIRKEDQAQFFNTPDQQTSLVTLLQTPSLTIGVLQDFQYAPQIDTLLKQYSGQSHVYTRAGIKMIEYYQMLLAHRIDYTLQSAVTFTSTRQVLPPADQERVLFLPVIENLEPNKLYVACNDTPIGREIMPQINATLLTDAYKTAVTQRLLEFLPENLRAEYRQINLETMGQ